jgi:predicted ATPase
MTGHLEATPVLRFPAVRRHDDAHGVTAPYRRAVRATTLMSGLPLYCERPCGRSRRTEVLPVLSEFYVDNFKSLINVAFRPRSVNLLLGLNNSGKTNLCQAIKFLSATSMLSVDEAAARFAGGPFSIRNFFLDKDTVDFRVRATVPWQGEDLSFRYELSIRTPRAGTVGEPPRVESESLSVSGEGFPDVTLVENTPEQVRLLHEAKFSQSNEAKYVLTKAPRDKTMLNRLYDMETNPRANAFKDFLGRCLYYDLQSEALLDPKFDPATGAGMNINGKGLASAIHHLKTTDERRYRGLVATIRLIDPAVEVFNFSIVGDAIATFVEDREGHGIPLWNLSSGFLKYLAMSYVLTVVAPRYNGVIIIEEPENGLYVGRLRDIMDQAKAIPDGKAQIVFTTHSPYFVDLFDEHIESVFVVKRGKQHSEILQPDPDLVRRYLQEFPLGEQHFREMLT